MTRSNEVVWECQLPVGCSPGSRNAAKADAWGDFCRARFLALATLLSDRWDLVGILATLLDHAAEHLPFTARMISTVLRVARTIADLAGKDCITPPYLAEALQYQRRAGL